MNMFEQLIINSLKQNPNYARAIEAIQAHGGDAKAAFYDEAKKAGMNPQDILNQASAHLNNK